MYVITVVKVSSDNVEEDSAQEVLFTCSRIIKKLIMPEERSDCHVEGVRKEIE